MMGNPAHRHAAVKARERDKPATRIGTALVLLVSLLLTLIALAVLSGNYQIRPVLSGSMRPGLPVGGVVVTRRVPLADIKVRDVIVFTRPDNPSEMVVHRVIALTRTGSATTVRTQGDANAVADPWILHLHGDTAYRATFSLPLLGYPAVWMHNLNRTQLLSYLAGAALLIGATSIWRKDRRRRAPRVAAYSTDSADPADSTCDDLTVDEEMADRMALADHPL